MAAYLFFLFLAASFYLTYQYLIQNYHGQAIDEVQNAWAAMAWRLVGMDAHVHITTGPQAGMTFQYFLGLLAGHQVAWEAVHADFLTLLYLPPASALVFTLATFAIIYLFQQHRGV
ncbi:MAG: hypothetical protein ACYDDT_00970 [Sulfuricella sp.]